MKKLLLSISVLISACCFTAKAQDDCLSLFPDKVGTVLVHKTFDAKNNLISTMTYKIENVYNYSSGEKMSINFMLTDKDNKVIDSGVLDAFCDNGIFNLKMKNRSLTPDVVHMLSTDTELVGDFLDYPDTFASDLPLGSDFHMSGGEFTLKSKNGDKKELTRVRVYDRKFAGNETITTPAKMFNAAKVTFNFEVTTDKKTTPYTGIEWYAPNAGIVRSETYKNKVLVNYTILTEVKE